MKEFLIQSTFGQGIGRPLHIIHLDEAVFCIQNDVPVLAPAAERAFLRDKYYQASKAIRQLAPDLSAKLDALQTPQAIRAYKARHIPALAVRTEQKHGI